MPDVHDEEVHRRRRIVIVCAAVLLPVAVGVGHLVLRMEVGRWQQESEASAAEAVFRVCSAWNPAELNEVSSPTLLAQMSDEHRAALLSDFRQQLGSLTKSGRPKGGALLSFGSAGMVVTAHYEVAARFERGDARIVVDLEKTWSRWRVTRFMVRFE